MSDIDEIRRRNICLLEAELGSPSIAAKTVGMTLAQYLNLREGAKDSKSGKPRGMRKETAWKFEDKTGKPRGWLDIDHSGPTVPVMGDILGKQLFPLVCSECGKVSLKSLIELEMNDRLPCGVCGITFNINSQYGNGVLNDLLKTLGYDGFMLRQRRKLD